MVWSTITGAGTSTATKFFGDVMNKINNTFNGTDVTDTVSIHSAVTWTFKGTSFRIRNPADTFSYIVSGGAIGANRTINLPVLTGDDTLLFKDFAALVKNKQLEDNTTTIVDDVDNTKAVKLQCTGITTGNTRTLTVPDFDGTIATLAGTEIFTNKTVGNSNVVTVRDDRFTLQDDADTTKQTVFQLSGITTGTTRTLTIPNASVTIAGLELAQTFTAYQTFFGVRNTIDTIAYAATTDLDFDDNEVVTLSLTGNVTFTTSNRASGKTKTVKILADASTRTLTFPAWIFIGAAAPANIAANKTAILTLTCFGTTDASIVAAYAVQP